MKIKCLNIRIQQFEYFLLFLFHSHLILLICIQNTVFTVQHTYLAEQPLRLQTGPWDIHSWTTNSMQMTIRWLYTNRGSKYCDGL